jgi:hypothetical protein
MKEYKNSLYCINHKDSKTKKSLGKEGMSMEVGSIQCI